MDITCTECGANVWIDQDGTAHWGEGITDIDHNLDADHTPIPER